MNKNLDKMIDEYTNNYSELFIEAFYIKYINDFDIKEFDQALEKLYQELTYKINNKIYNKLKRMQYPKEIYQKYQNKKED